MTLFRDDGIVLRTQKLGEADRIMLRHCGGRPPHPQQSEGGVR
ncbi:recombination protein O N-terminal domain-containing protein [Streptomyces spinoverrucosus]|nr:recombination protein O N-terminal domain-containing protein [Streptomyces spinoverrucosus]